MQSVFVWIRCVYLVNGESDAPAGEEQRAPANGWCDLETLLADDLEGEKLQVCAESGGIAIRVHPEVGRESYELRRLENVLTTG
jgi:hypothetical protein